MSSHSEPDLLRGVIAGTIAGILASFVMEQFQTVWSTASQCLRESGQNGDDTQESGDPATVKAAAALSQSLVHRPLAKEDKRSAGELMHYAFGVANGIVYGALAEHVLAVRAGAGTVFGAALWVVADEGIVPALGLSKAPAGYPASVHAYSFASHLVYGATLEGFRSLIRSGL